MHAPRRFVVGFGLVFTSLLISLWFYAHSGYQAIPSVLSRPKSSPAAAQDSLSTITPTRRHIAIASYFPFHFDVYMALAWTVERVLNNSVHPGRLQIFTPDSFRFGFQDVVESSGLFHGATKHWQELFEALADVDDPIDLLILGTCEADLRGEEGDQLLAAWDAREADKKFQLVCIVHNFADKNWQSDIAKWSHRGALRFLTISQHVANTYRDNFAIRAENHDPNDQYGDYEHIKTDVHVPVLKLDNRSGRSSNRKLSKVVIQGSFDINRRDYTRIFAELTAALHLNPGVWGYLPLSNGPSFLPRRDSSAEPFQLYLLGSGNIEVPTILKNLVIVHTKLDYPEFYRLMNEMDVCIPAFADNGYYEDQASSTFAMAVECDVPILVTERMKRSYTYANDDRVVITRPAAMREVEALRALRSGNASIFLETYPSVFRGELTPATRKSVQRMLDLGWQRSRSDFDAVKSNIWSANDHVVARLLRDL